MSVVLSEHLPLLATAPDGIQKLRGLILELAVRGKLVLQDPNDEPAPELLKWIVRERARLEAEGACKKSKPTPMVGEDELPFKLPANWVWTNLATVSLINPRNAADDSIEASFVPMAMIGNRFEGSHQQELRKWGEVKQGFTHFAEGDIGVAKITPCFENSKACVFAGLKNGIGAGTTELHVVRPIGQTLVPRYVLAYLKAPMFLAVGETKMTGTAGQKRLPKDFLEENPFPFPPLAEQHRIVAKVDELMALCDRLEAEQTDAESAHAKLVDTLLGTLTQSTDAADLAANWQRLAEHFDTLFTTESSIDALKQTILQLAVMGKLVPQDPSDEPASELLKSIAQERSRLEMAGTRKKSIPMPVVGEDERPFEVPEIWQWIRFSQLDPEFQNGESSRGAASGTEIVVLRLADISKGEISLTDTRSVVLPESSIKKYQLLQNDLLVIRVNGSAEIVGRLILCDESLAAIYCDHFIRVRIKDTSIAHRFLRLIGDAPVTRRQIQSLFITTAGQKTVNQGHIGGLMIPFPPIAEQHRIVAKVDELMTLCDRLKADLAESRRHQERLASTLIESALQAA